MEIFVDDQNTLKINRNYIQKIIELTSPYVQKQDLLFIANTCIDEIKNNIQNKMHVVSGNLLSSIGIYEETEDSVLIGSDEQYALYLEYGRGPVRPVNKKALHWVDPDTGEDVFTKYAGPSEPTFVFEQGVLAGAQKAVDQLVNKKVAQLK